MLARLEVEYSVASSGEEALERLGSDWDLVLVDCRMLGTDGGTAVKLWREREEGRTRIVGMTSPGKGERAEDVEARGMDGVLIKPLTVGKLAELLKEGGTPPGTGDADEDFRELLEGYAGFESILVGVIQTFIASWPEERSRLEAALAAGDVSEIQEVAHKLKGECLTLSLKEAAALALKLETQASAGAMGACRETGEELAREGNRRITELDELAEKLQA
jgi:CheY-like chemotaxis protein